MPELPSLEIFKRYFDSTSLNQKIQSVDVQNPEILINVSPKKLENKLKGQKFIGSRRYGKYLFSHLDNDYYLILHFGMTGYLKYNKDDFNPYTRLSLSFKKGNLGFIDMRKFGKIGLTRDVDHFIYDKNLGPDALEIDWKTFKEKFHKKKGLIKPLLMNQNFIAGIGNLYADEILYQSGVHPLSKADKLSEDKVKQLYRVMKRVLNKAIEYKDKPFSLPSSFLLPHRQREGECPQGGPLNVIKVGGRTTYYCAEHQKLFL
jgi:formamidopyrimidine-DNA glycosylase